MSLLALTHVKGPQKMAIIILNSAMLVRQLRKGKFGSRIHAFDGLFIILFDHMCPRIIGLKS